MAQEKCLFERMDDIQLEISDILKDVAELKAANNAVTKQNQVVKQPVPQGKKFNLTEFIIGSKKYFRWFGSNKEFNSKKLLALTFYILLFVFGILSTIFTAKSYGGYSPISAFENVWLIFTFIIIINISGLATEIRDVDLEKRSTNKFAVSKLGLHYDTNKKKNFYYAFYWIAIISSIFNMIFVGTQKNSQGIGLCIVFEIIFIVLMFAASFFKIMLTSGYHFAIYEGFDNFGKKIRFAHDPIGNKVMTYEEFSNLFLRNM